MTNLPRTSLKTATLKSLSAAAIAITLGAAFAAPAGLRAQTAAVKLADRISGQVDNSRRAALVGSAALRAVHSTDLGAVPSDTPLQGINVVFSRSAAQQADLLQLIAAQQTPGSPSFHQWLTPAQFGARFGVSDNDLATTEQWLQSQGFTVVSVSPSRESLTVSGTARAIEFAFGTPLHYFKATSGSFNVTDAATHIAPAADLTLPAALSPIVLAVGNLSDYRPKSYAVQKPTSAFTSSQTGSHFLTPKDVATIYDIPTSFNGAGQTIVVAGQTAVIASDISNFQTAAGVASNPPVMVLVPNTGTSTINPNGTNSGDEAEADLDLEYSSSIATGAKVEFVYTGNNANYSVFDSVFYAIQNQLAPIITVSYGECEAYLNSTTFNQFESYFQQAASQGQTVINSSGDSGSTSCYGTGGTASFQQQVVVSYPASSAYVTGLGGTEFLTSAVAVGNNTYFTAQGSTDVIGSALSYIPEMAWNDDSTTTGLSSGGGGTSILSSRPSWQTGVPGIPAGNFRLVPDISLDSSPNNAGYLYCSSDVDTQVTGSCATGFRASNGQSLTVAGGTSFAAPIFAGMLAIINQAKGYNTGEGLINPTFYTLASNATTYASAFHDITIGGNQCTAGTTICGTGADINSYATTTGYDEATGLGSIDLTKLITAWPKSASSLLGSSTTATASNLSPAVGVSDAITVQVAGTTTTPTGTVTVTDNGSAALGSPFALVNGSFTYTYIPTTTGIHTVVFTYSGNTTYGSSKGTVLLNVGSTTFTVAAPAVSVTAGSTVTETVTVASINGYTGTVNLSVNYPTALTNSCYTSIPASATLTAAKPSTTVAFTIFTASGNCTGIVNPLRTGTTLRSANTPAPAQHSPWRNVPGPATLAGLLLFGCFKRRSRFVRSGVALGIVLVFGLAGFGLTGCSNGNSGSTTPVSPVIPTTTNAPTGAYSLTLIGQDSVDSAVTATTTFTLTVQ